MMNRFNLGFYSHLNIVQGTWTEAQLLAEAQTWCLSWEWTSLVLANMLELPFTTTDVWVDKCLYVYPKSV